MEIPVYLESGQKRTFAGAIEWPGWCRSGRDEASALQALVDAAPRYARLLAGTPLGFQPLTDVAALTVVERLAGNTTTDFGAPDGVPASDAAPFDAAALERARTLLTAFWAAFDSTVASAAGRELRKGPRGGGREVEGIVRHVLGADQSYVGRLAWKVRPEPGEALEAELTRTRQAILAALEAATRGEMPERGPRGGALWKPRYFVRRTAWHLLDHLWEIEERLL